MQDLINEVRKLIEYKGKDSSITNQDIDKLCIKQIQAEIGRASCRERVFGLV